jgi:hypothetical protein
MTHSVLLNCIEEASTPEGASDVRDLYYNLPSKDLGSERLAAKRGLTIICKVESA